MLEAQERDQPQRTAFAGLDAVEQQLSVVFIESTNFHCVIYDDRNSSYGILGTDHDRPLTKGNDCRIRCKSLHYIDFCDLRENGSNEVDQVRVGNVR